jgi:hypothetical protein
MVSRWPVVLRLPVEDGDRDADGRLTDGAIARMFAATRAAYFERCHTVAGSQVTLRDLTTTRASAAVDDDGVTVSVSVVEVFPDRFTMNARVRPVGPAEGDGVAGTAWCSVSPGGGGEVTDAMRDELIALAHGATQFH